MIHASNSGRSRALLPGGHTIDAATVAGALSENASGSDIREIVRPTAVAGEAGHVSSAALLAEVGSGRYRAAIPERMYM
ncbi:hypothetical protein MHEI_19960 [Mycobacterium heidelbergense]|nr:hypothetical protein MHEI_19960 [Mycobacterium heidelbergense]